MTLSSTVKKYIQTNSLFAKGDKVIVGVSGGADSITLLHVLNQLKHDLGIQLYVAHYNHNLRRESKADQRFVQEFCKRLNIDCFTDEWTQTNQSKRGSIEELARKKRFAFFLKLTKKLKAQKVTLGHTKNDLAETVLMRILRGTGLLGLQSILPKRSIEGVAFVRPLLNVERADIEQYVHSHKLSFREDPTNKDIKFTRNHVRKNLLPLLHKEYNQNIYDTLSNLAQNSANDYDFLHSETHKKFAKLAKVINKTHIRFDRKQFAKQHPALRNMLIRLSIIELVGDTNCLSFTHLLEINELIKNRPNKSIVNLPKKIKIALKDKYISIYK